MSAWDRTGWFVPGPTPRDPPPYLVHVDIEAPVGPPPTSVGVLGRPQSTSRISDALLDTNRAPAAASLGWARWYGKLGQLILVNGNGSGEQAGHLIFYFHSREVHYDVSLPAWASKLRISGHGASSVVSAPQSGAALPHVIATLKAIVGSALGR